MVRAFLIGAGATRARYRSAPLNLDFFRLLSIKNRVLYQAISDTILPSIEHINPPNLVGRPLHSMGVEEVMKLSYDFPHSIRTSFLESLYLAIYELLTDATESSEGDMSGFLDGDVMKPPTLIKTLLLDHSLRSDDFFITLNYDLYLDREILSIQNKIDYGINREQISESHLPLDFSKNPSFSVYHLHGSLNWEFIEGKIKVSQGATKPGYNRLGSSLILIPPGEKEIDSILEPIWKTAERRLLDADELIIIGCSLNPTDTELITLIKKFVKKKGTKNIKVIYFRNPKDLPSLIEYDKIIGDGFKQHPYGFNINGPDGKPGAIEFIFDRGNN